MQRGLSKKHGDQFIDRIEMLVRRDGQFCKLLGGHTSRLFWINILDTPRAWDRAMLVGVSLDQVRIDSKVFAADQDARTRSAR